MLTPIFDNSSSLVDSVKIHKAVLQKKFKGDKKQTKRNFWLEQIRADFFNCRWSCWLIFRSTSMRNTSRQGQAGSCYHGVLHNVGNQIQLSTGRIHCQNHRQSHSPACISTCFSSIAITLWMTQLDIGSVRPLKI
jgi:hypothetical protein